MAVSLYQADALTHIEFYQKKVSTAIAFNEMVYIDANGFVAPAVDITTDTLLGLCQKTIATTDSDYAVATRIPVLVPGPNAVFLFDVTTGSAAQTDVGENIDIDDSKNVDVVASTYDLVHVVGIISATQVLGKMNLKSGVASA